MKRNILLGFLLVGLVVMEWGCCKDRPFEIISHKLTGLEVLATQWEDYSYERTYYEFGIESKLARVFQSSNSVFASIGPFSCEDEGYGIEIINVIDSFSVLSDRVYQNSLDVTPLFVLFGDSSLVSIQSMNNHYLYERWYLNTAPTETDTFQFTFQFFDTEGNMFETTTDPIVITP
jgi:hypothetical protein|tara:strand:- start:24 stop:551 length:528 start_codon:yes stop_codon:yes gene_type:complete